MFYDGIQSFTYRTDLLREQLSGTFTGRFFGRGGKFDFRLWGKSEKISNCETPSAMLGKDKN